MIASKGGAGEPADMLLPGRAGGVAAVGTLASTICGPSARRRSLDRGSSARHHRSCGFDPRIRV